MGNICRSPTAEAVFRAKVEAAGLAESVEIDSAGTHSYNVGDSPDPRSAAAAAERGYDLAGLRGRQLSTYDADRFDYVIAMDRGNFNRIVDLFGGAEPDGDQLGIVFGAEAVALMLEASPPQEVVGELAVVVMRSMQRNVSIANVVT